MVNGLGIFTTWIHLGRALFESLSGLNPSCLHLDIWASRKNSPYQKLDKYTDFTCFNKDIH